MLKTGCIFDKREGYELRISVVPRYLAEDNDMKIPKNSYDEWEERLAPPKGIMEDYLKNKSWEKFESEYIQYLDSVPEAVEHLSIGALGSSMDIRLVCLEKTPEACHRKILAEQCQRMYPDLKTLIE